MKQYAPEHIRNVAIVGHGGSGKTMLVEHMLYTAGAVERVGTIDAGNTQSDHDPLEVRRKISVSASVLPLEWHGHKINLIDVPGYPDFIGDLHGVARVVESMVIVCEAKAELDVGFDLAYEVAEKYGLATCIFVNKLERDNADFQGLIDTLDKRYGRKIVLVQIPIGHQIAFSGVLDLLNMKVYKGKDRGIEIDEIPKGYAEEAAYRREKMMDAAAEGDDELAMKYLDGEELNPLEIEHGLLIGTETGRVVPVLLGSAASGIGVAPLLDRIVGELPSPKDRPKIIDDKELNPDPNDPLTAFCFKTTADPYVGKINYIRVFTGSIKQDQVVMNLNKEKEERMHNLYFPHGKGQEPATLVTAGDICAIAKLANTHTGDTLSSNKSANKLSEIEYPHPVYSIAIKPASKADEDKLGPAIEKLLEEDPTLRHHLFPSLHMETLEGMGDIHLEVAIEKLKNRFGVSVVTTDMKVPYKETVTGTAKAQGRHKRQTGGKGQFGDCWIEIEPLPRGEGFQFVNKVVGGAIPKNFIPAIEKGIRETMEHGVLAGYEFVDVKVTVYDGSYHDVDSSEMAFKIAGSLAFKAAVMDAKPVILEPILDVEIEAPDEFVGDITGDLNGRRGRLKNIDQTADGRSKISAEVPMVNMLRYALELRSLTRGRGRYSQSQGRYEVLPYDQSEKLVQAYEKTRKENENAH